MKFLISFHVAILIALTPGMRSAARHGVIPTVDVSPTHPRLLFSQSDLPEIKKRVVAQVVIRGYQMHELKG